MSDETYVPESDLADAYTEAYADGTHTAISLVMSCAQWMSPGDLVRALTGPDSETVLRQVLDFIRTHINRDTN